MAINTYEDSFGDIIRDNAKTIFTVLGIIVILVGGFFGLRWYLSKDDKPLSSGIIRDWNVSTGNKDSQVKLVYVVDFQCPVCKSNNPAMNTIKDDYADKIEIIYKNFPLDIHPQAKGAAYAIMAANDQNKHFEFVDKVFAVQEQLSNSATLENIATELNLDKTAWNSRRNSSEIREQVEQDIKDVKEATMPKSSYTEDKKVQGTPTTILFKDDQIIDWWTGLTNQNPEANAKEIKSRIDKVIG